MNLLLRMTGLFHLPYFLFKPVFRIRLSFHADPGSQKCPFGSGSRPLIFYSNPDPRGVKIKKGNLYHQIFNKIVKDDIKTLLKISEQKVLQKDPCFCEGQNTWAARIRLISFRSKSRAFIYNLLEDFRD